MRLKLKLKLKENPCAVLDYPNEDEREAASILLEFPSLIYKSNLTRNVPVWGSKNKRKRSSTINHNHHVVPLTNGEPCQNEKSVMVKALAGPNPNPYTLSSEAVDDEPVIGPALGSGACCLGESESEPKKVTPQKQQSRKERRKPKQMELREQIDLLVDEKKILQQEEQKIEAYLQKLTDYNLKLKALKEELARGNEAK